MATGNSSTPVKVPASASTYTPATQDPDLRSQINQILIRDGHVVKIQDHLLHALNAHNANWPTTIQNHALSLLRSGEVISFPALLSRVMDDVRQDTVLHSSSSSTSNGNGNAIEVNGTSKKANGVDKEDKGNLALPQSVIDEAIRITRESLEQICEIDATEKT